MHGVLLAWQGKFTHCPYFAHHWVVLRATLRRVGAVPRPRGHTCGARNGRRRRDVSAHAECSGTSHPAGEGRVPDSPCPWPLRACAKTRSQRQWSPCGRGRASCGRAATSGAGLRLQRLDELQIQQRRPRRAVRECRGGINTWNIGDLQFRLALLHVPLMVQLTVALPQYGKHRDVARLQPPRHKPERGENGDTQMQRCAISWAAAT